MARARALSHPPSADRPRDTAETKYAQCYGPRWGRFKDRTRPVPGNHEYINGGRPPLAWYARDYFDYCGHRAVRSRLQG